ncbi:MAG: hypothetical protein J5983_01180 [Ruminococcus sp.]|nr:hypothetical protein [Ruminococcus sp.]
MGFKVGFDDLRGINEVTSQKLSSWQDDLVDLQGGIQKLVDLDSFKGKTADSVKAYYNEVHYLMMSSINTALMDFMVKYLLYTDGYYDIDTDHHAKLNEETMNSAKKQYEKSMTNLSGVQTDLRNALNEVSDIFYVGVPGTSSLEDYHEEAISKITTTIDKVYPYEQSILNTELKQLEELITNVRAYIQEYKNGDRNIMANYTSGDYIYDENIYALAVSMNATSQYHQEHQAELEEAIAQQEKVYAKLQEEYEKELEEELAKQRADQGAAQMLMGGLAVVVGVAAIVCTAGAATPVVVTAAVAGTCSAAYGVSEMVEGGQHVYYGLNGDPYTSAWNPTRDTIFGGNQEAYDMWGQLSMTVASTCVPVGKSVQGLKGVQAVKAGTLTVAKEVGMDYVEDKVAEKVSEEIIEHAGIESATGQTLVKLGTNYAVGKASDATAGKVIDEKVVNPQMTKWESDQVKVDAEATGEGFAGLMDESDASRYKSGEQNQVEIETAEIRRDANASGKGLSGLMDESDAQRMDEWTNSQEKPERIKEMEAEEAKAKAEQEAAEQKRIKEEKIEKIKEEASKNKPAEPEKPYTEGKEKYDEERKERESANEQRSNIWQNLFDSLYAAEG